MPVSLVIRRITPSDTLPLRHALLRPHQPEETCVFPGDNDDTTVHLGAFLLEQIKGIASLYRENLPNSEAGNGYRFRALAITEMLRRQGHGLALLRAVENHAREQGADYLWANARTTALDFYRKADYRVGDEEFIVTGVGPHRVVRKDF